jgi:hypothetical protein
VISTTSGDLGRPSFPAARGGKPIEGDPLRRLSLELQAEIEGDRSGLPPGSYNVFLANVDGNWKVYAEAGGQVVAEAASVQERADTPENMPPKFRSGSFCWWV